MATVEINIQNEMTDIIHKLKDVFDGNLQTDPNLSIRASKELRGFLVELNSIIRGRVDEDDVYAMELFRMVKAVKKFGNGNPRSARLDSGKGERLGLPPLGGDPVCIARLPVLQGSEETDGESEADG